LKGATRHPRRRPIARRRRSRVTALAIRKCSRCLQRVARRGQRWCLACHAESMRRTRPKHGELDGERRKRANCRSYANEYLRRGKLKRQRCSVCGAARAQMHHEDYAEPLQVTWFCRTCHLALHAERR